MPYLPLFGHWLRDVGFDVGTHVKIDAFEGRIIIDVVAPEYPLKRETHYLQVEEWDNA